MLTQGDAAKPHVFISYAREDREQALRLRTSLVASGFDVWWDDAIHAGEHWSARIQDRLATAHCVLVVWSQRAEASPWVRHEASTAMALDKLVSVTLDEPPALPFDAVQAEPIGDWSGDLDARPFVRTAAAVSEKIRAGTWRRRARLVLHGAYTTAIVLLAILGIALWQQKKQPSALRRVGPEAPTSSAPVPAPVCPPPSSCAPIEEAMKGLENRARRLIFCVAREKLPACETEVRDLNSGVGERAP